MNAYEKFSHGFIYPIYRANTLSSIRFHKENNFLINHVYIVFILEVNPIILSNGVHFIINIILLNIIHDIKISIKHNNTL